jgi:hypothetical protein
MFGNRTLVQLLKWAFPAFPDPLGTLFEVSPQTVVLDSARFSDFRSELDTRCSYTTKKKKQQIERISLHS